MTRKDYELITDALYFSHQSLSDLRFLECIRGIERATESIADYLQADNPKFDRELFIKNVNGDSYDHCDLCGAKPMTTNCNNGRCDD